jgi:hypothetical protein
LPKLYFESWDADDRSPLAISPPLPGSHPVCFKCFREVTLVGKSDPALPTAHAFADQCQSALKTTMIISSPQTSMVDQTLYIQLINGLFAINGCIPTASVGGFHRSDPTDGYY